MKNISVEKIIYAVLRRLAKAMDEDEKIPKFNQDIGHEAFGISEKKWTNIILDMKNAGYIDGIDIIEDGNEDYDKIHINRARITLPGRKYLKVNSILAKSYEAAKELREWIKMLKP